MKLHKRVAYIFSSAILSMSSMLVLIAPVVKAAPDVCTWSGAGGNALMSNAGNWTCSVDTLDLTGDSIVIPSTATAFTLNNDLVGASFVNITANGVLDNGTCNTKNSNITGNQFTLSGSITLNHTGTCANGLDFRIAAPLVVGGSSTQYIDSTLSQVSESATFIGAVSGSNSIVARGVILITATSIDQSVGLGADNGGSISSQVGDCTNRVISNNVSLADDATIELSDVSSICDFTITNLSLTSSATFTAGDATVTVTNFTDNGYTYKVADGSPTKLIINGQTLEGAYVETVITTDQSGTGFSTNGKEKIIVNAGGITGAVNVLQYGYLMGNGGTVGTVNVATGGFLAPGNSPGCLIATGALAIAGTYEVEVQGADPCTGYDQMNVTGGVTLTGGALTVATSGFTPVAGATYTIINNITAGPVTGTFNGLTEGAEVVNTGVTYTISYQGGDGNDVVLTVKAITGAIPGAPNTGVAMLTNNPLLTTIVTLMMVAGLVLVARKQNQPNQFYKRLINQKEYAKPTAKIRYITLQGAGL